MGVLEGSGVGHVEDVGVGKDGVGEGGGIEEVNGEEGEVGGGEGEEVKEMGGVRAREDGGVDGVVWVLLLQEGLDLSGFVKSVRSLDFLKKPIGLGWVISSQMHERSNSEIGPVRSSDPSWIVRPLDQTSFYNTSLLPFHCLKIIILKVNKLIIHCRL